MHMARQDNEYTRAMFDYSFTAALAVTLKADQLVCDMRVVNTDSKEFDFTAALHTYFAANVGDVRVEGLGGLSYLDKTVDVNNPPTKELAEGAALAIEKVRIRACRRSQRARTTRPPILTLHVLTRVLRRRPTLSSLARPTSSRCARAASRTWRSCSKAGTTRWCGTPGTACPTPIRTSCASSAPRWERRRSSRLASRGLPP